MEPSLFEGIIICVIIIIMSRFSLQLFNYGKQTVAPYQEKRDVVAQNYFNKDMNYLVCSYGGSGSTALLNYLSFFGNVYHVHDRHPPNKLSHIGKENSKEDVYNEWFNSTTIPEDKIKNYKVIFIYRNPLPVIFSRFAQAAGPNIPHLQHIKCQNNGDINLFDVLKTGRDLYGVIEFFNNYTVPTNRNYGIYAVKYEMFWDNIPTFNRVLGIPDVKSLYPVRQEKPRRLQFVRELTYIYSSLINKMNSMRFIELIRPTETENEVENNTII